MKTEYKPLSIYIHIPFCIRKCLYCDFLSQPADERMQEEYVNCLIQEIKRESKRFAGHVINTVFIGGGTPSVLPEGFVEMIVSAVYEYYRMANEPEITIEVNPGTVSVKKLQAYHRIGINRLSIGLQSAIDEELKALGRIHTADDFFATYRDAVKSGFNNINVDLMTAIPMQTIESFKETVKQVLALDPIPSHVSAYSLIIEEGTPFYENTPELPDEDTDRMLYKITNDILTEKGYHRYEISNYAKAGYECRHNKVYWKRGEYAGFGTGAASLVQNTRYSNIKDTCDYISRIREGLDVREGIQKLSVSEQMEEFMFLGLRLTEGISMKEFEDAFGKTIEEVYPGLIGKLEQQGLLLCKRKVNGERERIYLSEFGLDVSNVVMEEFLLT